MKNYKRKTREELKKELDGYIESATEKINQYLTNPKDVDELLTFMSQFHHYSMNNQAMIQDQFRGAYAVGSFKTFSDAGFKINKGEKAIKILVPTPVTLFTGLDGVQKNISRATQEEKQLIKQNKLKTTKKNSFKLGNVFDISQTNATIEDLPKIFPNRHYDFSYEGNPQEMLHTLKTISEKMGVPVTETLDTGASKGTFFMAVDGSGKGIKLNARLDDTNKISTLIHEMAHATLHSDVTNELTTAQEEFQAELVSNVVSKHFGLNTDEESISYIASWTNNGQNLEDKRALLKDVHATSTQLIKEIYETFDPERVHEQTQTQEVAATKSVRLSKEEIAEAEKVSILDLANAKGLATVRHSKDRFYLADDPSVAIFTKTNSFYDFAQTTTKRGGNSIDFAQQILGANGFKEAVAMLNNDDFEKVTVQPLIKEAFNYDESKESKTFDKVHNYLVNERGIDPRLVTKLHEAGYIREDKRGNALFCWYDKNEMVGCTEQGTIKSDKFKRGSWKGIQPNSPANSHGFNVQFGEPKNLKFFEASIDALSYASLHPEKLTNTWLISMEGLNESKLLDYTKRATEQLKTVPNSISVCVDNDEAGLGFWNGLTRLKREVLTNEIPQKPAGLETLEKWDWNDQLRFLSQEHDTSPLVMAQSSGMDY